MDALLGAIRQILDGEDEQITIRHLFYRVVGLGVLAKTEKAYRLLCSHLSKWRKDGEIRWDAFTDSTRWWLRSPTFNGIEDALSRCRETYRRDLWSTQENYCEVWVEKDAIAPIVYAVANSFGVPTFVSRGFASLSSLYNAAQTFNKAEKNGKVVTIFHLGDYDPSGYAAGESIEETLVQNFDCSVTFDRIAVQQWQIHQWNLPTRPVKNTDSRAAKWIGGQCVELDSIPPSQLRGLVEKAITDLIDPREWEQLKTIEAEELATLGKISVGARKADA
jgi:hypothetical protein